MRGKKIENKGEMALKVDTSKPTTDWIGIFLDWLRLN